ncbi:unnamed protein product, partial [Brassica oleracea]
FSHVNQTGLDRNGYLVTVFLIKKKNEIMYYILHYFRDPNIANVLELLLTELDPAVRTHKYSDVLQFATQNYTGKIDGKVSHEKPGERSLNSPLFRRTHSSPIWFGATEVGRVGAQLAMTSRKQEWWILKEEYVACVVMWVSSISSFIAASALIAFNTRTVVAITKSKLIQLRSAIGVNGKRGAQPEQSTVLKVDRLRDRTGRNILQLTRSNNKRLTRLLQVVVFLQQQTRVKPAHLLLDRPLAGTSFSRMSCVSNVFEITKS